MPSALSCRFKCGKSLDHVRYRMQVCTLILVVMCICNVIYNVGAVANVVMCVCNVIYNVGAVANASPGA